MPRMVTVTMPRRWWLLFQETLELDSESIAFDKELRDDLKEGLKHIQVGKPFSSEDT